MKHLLLWTCLAALQTTSIAQTSVTEINFGQVRARLYGAGRIGSHPVSGQSGFFLPTNLNTLSPMYTSGLWLSGTTDAGETRSSAHLYGSSNDFRTGPLSTDGTASISAATALEYDRFWNLSATEIANHQLWFACQSDPDCDMNTLFPGGYTIPQSIAAWPAMGDMDAGQSLYLAPFVDVDANGYYNPLGGDYPCVPGDVSVFHIFNDKNQAQTGGASLGVEIHMTTFGYWAGIAWDHLNYTLFTRYRIINRSSESYSNFRIGLFADFDLGCYSDDIVGTDVGRNLFYVLNGANSDFSCETPGYGANPPAFGAVVLKGPRLDFDGEDNVGSPALAAYNGYGFNDGIVDNERHGLGRTMYWNGAGATYMTDPNTEPDFQAYISGRWKNQALLTYGGIGYGGVTSSAFAFPGNSDPNGLGTGGVPQQPWSETSAVNTPGDRKMIGVMGPITMVAGREEEILVAYTYARAASGGPLASRDALFDRTDVLRNWAAAQTNWLISTQWCTAINTGIREIVATRLPVAPNPVQDELRVTLPDANARGEWSILDGRGSVVTSGQFEGQTPRIDVRLIPQGMYVLHLKTSDGAWQARFVKL